VTLAILWWSTFTALTGAAWNFVSLLVVRFVFGAVEAALSPAIASAFSRWIPVSERSTAFGAFLSGGRIGGAMTPPIAAFLLIRYGWRWMFVFFGSMGVLWAVLWFYSYRNHPAEHPKMTREELAVIEAGLAEEDGAPQEKPRFATLLRSRRLLMLLSVAFGYTFLWQFYITWFPTYLVEGRGLPLSEAAIYAGLPFLFGVAANLVGGFLTDVLSRRYNPRLGRTAIGFGGILMASVLLFAGTQVGNARAGAILIASAAFTGDMFLGAAWASALSIGGKAGGAIAGLMNAASNAGGFASPVLLGWALHVWKDWNAVLMLAVVINAIAAFLWLGVNPREKVPVAEVTTAQ
jgi:ACS family glucarate transporter-like MFS transporter